MAGPNKACTDAQQFITDNKAPPSVATAAAAMDANPGPWQKKLSDSSVGLLGYCPHKHRSQFDCVSATTRMTEAIAALNKIIEPLKSL